MLSTLSPNETIRQSQDAFLQWKDTWYANAKKNGEVAKRKGTDIRDIMMSGRNRLAVLVALGQSLEERMDDLQAIKGREGVDIICVDKAFGVLAKRGIIPKIVAVADAQVSFDFWTERYIALSKDSTLIVNATANPVWAKKWRGPVYVVVCKDSAKTEVEIARLAGVNTLVPAGSNVGNSLVVEAAEVFGYQEMLLVGYDFSWYPGRNYYAFSGDSDGISNDKRSWQMGGYELGIDGRLCYTSSNLKFAARWLTNYYIGKARSLQTGLNIRNCSRQGVLDSIPEADLMRRIDLFKYQTPGKEELDQMAVARARVIRANTEPELRAALMQNVSYYADILCVPKEAAPWMAEASIS